MNDTLTTILFKNIGYLQGVNFIEKDANYFFIPVAIACEAFHGSLWEDELHIIC